MLAIRTLRKLARNFAAYDHRPSEGQWAALADLANTLEKMANGVAEPSFCLSSLDPGVGKSQTIVRFVDELLASPEHEHVGVLLCVSRLSEVTRMVEDIGIPAEMLAVLTSDGDRNALGKAEPDQARVIITTQQMVERRLAERSFAEAGLFTFQGKPRAVRIWDEAFLPGQPITLAADSLAFVLRRFTQLSATLRADILGIFNDVEAMPSGAIYQVPDFADRHPSISLNDVLATTETGANSGDDRKLRADEQAVLSSLWYLSGKTVTIRRDGRYNNTVLDYRETLPSDLAPMVILDASGRVRETYRDMEKERGGLVRLHTAVKRYAPLTVNVWQTGGGKSAFAKHGAKLASGIAKAIDSKPNERWLVVTHKDDNRVGNIEKAVRELLNEASGEDVSFIQWGSHSAENKYSDVPNIVLAGTLFYRGSYYEALKRLAAGRRATDGTVTEEELTRTVLGEHAHLILQALCRGSVRKSDGDQCHRAEAWIIASARSGIPQAIPTIFPGCTVKRWKPIPRTLKGPSVAALEYVEKWAKQASPDDMLPFRVIQRDLGIDRMTFRDTVRQSIAFSEEIAELGVEEWGAKSYRTAYRLAALPPTENVGGYV